jgi:hypothetical protein
MSFNFVGQFKALIFLSKHHWQMCLVHEIDQRIICKKSYGQSVAMISLRDIPIHLFRIQRKRLMMNCSITTINQAHKHSPKGFFNDIRSVTRVILFIHVLREHILTIPTLALFKSEGMGQPRFYLYFCP